MRVIAAIQVHAPVTPIGTRSRVFDDLEGRPVLRRTVERLLRAEALDAVHLVCPPDVRATCDGVLEGLPVVVHEAAVDMTAWSSLVRVARKWSLDGWRGGLGGTGVFDEFVDARVLAVLAGRSEADVILAAPQDAVLIDPNLVDRMCHHIDTTEEDVRLVFAPTPPGLSGLLMRRELIEELVKANSPAGWMFSYKPNTPAKDLIFQPCCLEVPAAVRYAGGRLLADTARGVDRLANLVRNHGDAGAETLCRALIDNALTHVEPLPREVEIELTTADPFPDSRLHPRGEAVGRRGPIDPDIVRVVAEQLGSMDDSLVTLGGFGDPLRHPQFSDILAILKQRAYGVAVRTTGADLDEASVAAMIESEVDVLQITLDAWTRETFDLVHRPGPGAASLDDILSRIERFNEQRKSCRAVRPVLVPTMTKSRLNLDELDDFHDGWLRAAGAVSIDGASTFAGQWEDHVVAGVTPPRRTPCRRLASRAIILADGRMVACDQDFRGTMDLGSIRDNDLRTLWHGPAMAALREAHARENLDARLCATCTEWHRP